MASRQLPPHLFREYVVTYTGPLCKSIAKHGGCPRVHSHGRLRGILEPIVEMGTKGLDPCEPPPQGDMSLAEIRAGLPQTVLFGNIEAADIENLAPAAFEAKVRQAVDEGPDTHASRFVLMPSACPYGREITPRTMTNYETMLRVVGA